MVKPRCLLTSHLLKPGDEVDRQLQEAGIETVFNLWHGGRTEEDMIRILHDFDAVIAGMDPYTPRVLDAAHQLKIIARAGVGYDAVDVKAATERGVAVCNAAGVNRHSVAELAIALMLQCSRHLAEMMASVQAGGWDRYEGFDLAGSTLGIVGLGTIGREVAQRMQAFEMRLLAHDVVRDQQFAEEHGITYVSLEELLRQSDIVTLHVFLNPQTRHMINAERLALMKPTAYLVNTARGGIVDSEALYQALKAGKIAGAALDVMEQEPLGESPLRGLPNCWLSPHVGGSSTYALAETKRIAAENVLLFLRGERPLTCVNPQVLK